MNVLVTGATGFLGSHLVDACLRQGDNTRVIVRATSDRSYLDTLKTVEQVHGDLTSSDSLRGAVKGVDVVYHSAARVTDCGTRRQFVAANVDGTVALLDAAKAAGVRRFVFVSSPSVVASGDDQVGIDEQVPYPAKPLSFYCETKGEAERRVLAANAPDFVTCAIRPRGIWGPRDYRGAIAKLLERMRAGKLPDLSGGRVVHANMCHCYNAAAACLGAAASDRVGGKAYFVTDHEVTDIWAFVRELAEMFEVAPPRKVMSPMVLRLLVEVCELIWSMPFVHARYAPPLSRYGVSLLAKTATYDTSAAVRDFGYAPTITRAQGLDELRAWVRANGGLATFLKEVSR